MIRKAILGLAAAGMAAGGAAGAEPDHPNKSLFAQSGFTRAPLAESDARAEGLRGRAAVWNGNGWWQVFAFCGAMHGVQRLRMEAVGAPAKKLDAQKQLAEAAIARARKRLAADRGIGEDAAWSDAVEAEEAYWTSYFTGRTLDYGAEASTCKLAEARGGK